MDRSIDVTRYLGRAFEQLPLKEQKSLAGLWAAYEIYTPQTVPLRKIAALCESIGDCIRQLRERGLDPKSYEYVILK